ncbi:MAG: hypothetical protein HS111_28945 [Kofleriaceae bacterium]|nr:hypothetical protein [Kofleriaceae bacterium]
MSPARAKALGELGDTLINRFDQDLIDYRAELLRIAARFPSLRDRYQRQVAQANDEHGASFDGPWQILRARERGLDELEHRLQVTVARGALVELLHRASNKAESAQTRAFAQQLLTTIAITLAGNIAASAVRGAPPRARSRRAPPLLGKDARTAATMARAQQVGAAAGFAADVAVSTIGQKLQGDGASLLTLLALNVVEPARRRQGAGHLPAPGQGQRHGVPAQRAGRWALDVAYDKLDLSVQMIVGAAVDHASRILMGAASLDPSEQKARSGSPRARRWRWASTSPRATGRSRGA